MRQTRLAMANERVNLSRSAATNKHEGPKLTQILYILQELRADQKKADKELHELRQINSELKTELKAVHQEIKFVQDDLSKEIKVVQISADDLSKEIKAVQGSVEALSEGSFPRQIGPPSRELSNTTLPQGDWPTLPTISPPQSTEATLSSTAQWLLKDAEKSVSINITRVKKDLSNATVTINKLNAALQAHADTTNAKIIGVKALKQKWSLIFQDEQQAKAARQHKRWLEVTLPGARAIDETWFPIKLDHVQKAEIAADGLDTSTLRPDLHEMFVANNQINNLPYEVKKTVWISKPSHKISGSMIVWLSKKEAVNFFLQTNAVRFGNHIAGVSRYEAPAYPERCYNCNKFGHKQAACKGEAVCGICADTHQTRDCTNHAKPKCSNCGGGHQVTFKKCPVFITKRIALAPRSTGSSNSETALPTSTCL